MATTRGGQTSDTTGIPDAVQRTVVVGVDGSEGSSRALVWAADEARCRGATLCVVHAWHMPTMAYSGGAYLPASTYRDLESDAGAALDAQVAAVLGASPGERGGSGSLVVEKRVVDGPAAQVVLDCAKGAELVVVGSRGLGGFAGLLLGSVSAQVAHHARCPVVIVPG